MKTWSSIVAMLCVLGLAIAAMAEEKVVWSPKDGIGKSQTWQQKATAEEADGLLVVHLKEAEWSGAGLNFEGYWPEGAGVKAADYAFLVIEFKAEGVDADALQLTLKDNKHKPSGNVSLKTYCPGGVLPTEMTAVKIPVADFLTDKSQFETGVVWEIMVHAWTQGAKDVKVTLGKLAFTNE